MRTSPPTYPIGVGHIHPMSVRSHDDDCESAPTGQRPTHTAKALPPRLRHVDLLTGSSWLQAQSRRLVAPSRRCLTNGQRIMHQACTTIFGHPLFRERTLRTRTQKSPENGAFSGSNPEITWQRGCPPPQFPRGDSSRGPRLCRCPPPAGQARSPGPPGWPPTRPWR